MLRQTTVDGEQLSRHITDSRTREPHGYWPHICGSARAFDNGEAQGTIRFLVSGVEAIVHPSHIISSQYVSKTVRTTDGRTLTGLVVPGASGETIVILPSADRVVLAPRQVEAMKPSKISAMPDGLLDPLSLEEVADLFAYLQRAAKGTTLSRRPVESAPK